MRLSATIQADSQAKSQAEKAAHMGCLFLYVGCRIEAAQIK